MDYAVIMAGGTGKRLWPLSRLNRPKQVLQLLDGKTLLERCFERLCGIFDPRSIIVLTNAGYADLVRECLPELPFSNVIAEPEVRDTAGAIGLAATVLSKFDPDATMAVVTADQVIEPDEVFQQALTDAVSFVNHNPESLLTFAIGPNFPSTQLGYLKCGKPVKVDYCSNSVYKVEAFKEKPDKATAERYLKAGNYFWNSGMFVWKVKTLLANLQQFLPESTEPLEKIKYAWDSHDQQKILEMWFSKLPKISIDFAVMEKASNVRAIKLDCRWLDMGSFAALADIISSDENNNVVVAQASQLMDCKDNIIVTEDPGHLIAAVGLENMVIAHSPDATLVCPLDDTQRLKELLAMIKDKHGDKFL